MTYTIHKGKHRPSWWWLFFRLWYHKTVIRQLVTISFDCKYDLNGPDQDDNNKLFGIGYFPGPHKDSARFGWRYNKAKDRFIISAYCYVGGQRIMADLCEVFATKRYQLILTIENSYYHFTVMYDETNIPMASYSIPFWHKKTIGYHLGLFFGGNKPAPSDMSLQLNKI